MQENCSIVALVPFLPVWRPKKIMRPEGHGKAKSMQHPRREVVKAWLPRVILSGVVSSGVFRAARIFALH
jgi:hypothetical protein